LGPLLGRLSEDDLERFRHACSKRLQDHTAADGFELLKQIDVTVAQRR
jgi:hypothetical protein